MALTHLDMTVSNPTQIKKSAKLRFLVDSGAVYSVVPTLALKNLSIVPDGEREFILANGDKIVRKLGIARFQYKDYWGGAPVIFGEKGDSILLGATALEAMGLVLNPLQRELMKLPMVLGSLVDKRK